MQALFVGKNLPASAKFNYTLNMTCVSDPSVKIKATVLQYSTAGAGETPILRQIQLTD